MTDAEWAVCQGCWDQEAEKRPKMADVLEVLKSDTGGPCDARELKTVHDDDYVQADTPAHTGSSASSPRPKRADAGVTDLSSRRLLPDPQTERRGFSLHMDQWLQRLRGRLTLSRRTSTRRDSITTLNHPPTSLDSWVGG
jgi:hypothetical protein